jgi:ABC-2 type transport system ATP-binding protein
MTPRLTRPGLRRLREERRASHEHDRDEGAGQTLPAELGAARNLNRCWDADRARGRLAELSIPLSRKVGELSGGQQAQLALTLALARRPALLVLDEPLARLDPLARHDFMASVMAAVAEDGVSVVMSSHVLAELERIAD